MSDLFNKLAMRRKGRKQDAAASLAEVVHILFSQFQVSRARVDWCPKPAPLTFHLCPPRYLR